jgi:WD40 repeat protein
MDLRTEVISGGHDSGTIWGLAVSPNRRWLATGGHDGKVKLWDARTLRLVRTLTGFRGLAWCVAFSPDSKVVAAGSDSIRLWEVATGRQLHQFVGHQALVVSLAFHPNRPWLVSAADDGTVRLWDVLSGRPRGILFDFDEGVHGVAFRPDGRWLVAACHDRRAALWDMNATDLSLLARGVSIAPKRWLSGHAGAVRSVAFSADGRYLASGSEQGVIILWDGKTFDRLVTLRSGTGQIRCVCFSSGGELLAGAAYANRTIIWDLARLRRTLGELDLDW